MTQKTLYLAGKITGDSNYRDKFEKAARELSLAGFSVVNPAVLPDGFTYEAYIRISSAMLEECQAVCFLSDWQESHGAVREYRCAAAKNKEIFMFDQWQTDLETANKRLLDTYSCLPDSIRGHLEEQIVVLRPERLKPEYRTALNQLWFASHGNGCNPDAMGRSIFLTHITDGDSMAVYRDELYGIAKPEVLEEIMAPYPKVQEKIAGILNGTSRHATKLHTAERRHER